MKRISFVVLLCLAIPTVCAATGGRDVTPEAEVTDSARWSRELDEVVVTGQGGAIEKRRLSTNVTTVKAERLQGLATSRIDEMLQTALPNMKINISSGQPGATSIMVARGLSSAFGNATPVIYVDGIRVDNLNTATALTNDLNGGNHVAGFAGQTATGSALADIPTENIERIEYVPGGAATTLYGSDAANGVIQIFTRKGGTGRLNALFSTDLGVESATSDYYHFSRTRSLLHQSGFTQRYRLALDGGGEKGGWSLGAAMSAADGTITGNAAENKKYDLRFGAHARISSILSYEASFGAAMHHTRYARNGNEGLYGGLWTLECGDVTSHTYTAADGSLHSFEVNIDDLDDVALGQLKQLCHDGEALSDHRDKTFRSQTSHAFILTPIKTLTIKALLGLDYRHTNDRYGISYEWLRRTGQLPSLPTSSLRNFDRDYLSLTADISAQHRYRHGAFTAFTTLGFQYFSTDDHQTTLMGRDLHDGSLTIAGAATKTADEWKATMHQYGFFAQENLGLSDRYYLDFGVRADMNSAFGDNVGWQYYPKVGLSYMLSSEPFMQGVTAVNSARVFVNYGLAGNYPPAFSYQRTVRFLSFDGAPGATFGQYGNDNLGPERKASFEAGFNLQLLSHLNLGLTYYYARTRDALFDVPLPPSVGEGSCLSNAGEIENRGVELSLAVEAYHDEDWDVTLDGSLNTNRNRVISTGGTTPFAIGGFGTGSIQSMVSEGEPVGWLRAARTDLCEGQAVTQAYQNLGRIMPTVYGALSLNVVWRNLRLFASADYQAGGHVHSYDAQFRFRKGLIDPRVPDALLVALGMKADGSNRAEVQKAQAFNMTNWFVYSSDFLKVRNIGLTYTFHRPVPMIKELSAGFTVYNPFAITSCPVDPEATVSSSLSQGSIAAGGFNYATYSAPRQYIFTLKATL